MNILECLLLLLIAALFGMNTKDTPILGIPGDFWIIVGAMVLLMLIFFSYFKARNWF